MYKFLSLLDSKLPVIQPNQKFKLIWDFFIILIIIIYFFILPMQLSFNFFYEKELEKTFQQQNLSKSVIKFIIFLPEAILIVDTLLKFISGFYENGIIVTQKSLIIKHYLKKGLFFDLLAYLPVILHGFLLNFFDNNLLKLVQMFMFCKLKRVAVALSTFQEIISSKGRDDYILNALRLILTILFVTHLNACAWHAVAYFTYQKENWLAFNDLLLAPWPKRYYISFFWSLALYGGIGFGDRIVPQNYIEYTLGGILILISTFLSGYSLYSIFNLLNAAQKEDKEYRFSFYLIFLV